MLNGHENRGDHGGNWQARDLLKYRAMCRRWKPLLRSWQLSLVLNRHRWPLKC